MKRAVVIKMSGDVEMATEMANAIMPDSPAPASPCVEKPSTRLGIRAATGFRDWKSLFYGVFEKYGFAEEYSRHNAMTEKLILGWAIVCMIVGECYKRLSEWNRRP